MPAEPQSLMPGTALVTGAARRIGRAIALDLAAQGWRLGLHCLASREAAEGLAGEIAAAGGEAAVLQADLADAEQVARLMTDCSSALGAPSCLINNASMFAYDEVSSLTSEQWDAQLAVNLKAPVFLAKAMAEALPGDAAGNVINLLDQRVLNPRPQNFSYAVSKAGLWAATLTLAQALAPRVRVNAIGPGPTLKNVRQSDEDFARQCAATPLGIGTTPAEVAAAVRFILAAPAMTGQMIVLDGGQHLAWPELDDDTKRH
jgi:NAD(P)-dependent dehydrogenase (short-subunit alcohol dehydrogenase family)